MEKAYTPWNMAFDGSACVEVAEQALETAQQFTERFGSKLRMVDGVGWALKRTIEIARDALRRCPVQPGDRVEIAKRYERDRKQHMFEGGRRAVVACIDLGRDRNREPQYVAAIRFDRETWMDPSGTEHDIANENRHIFGIPVEYLRRVD